MPAIDLDRLARQVERLEALFAAPGDLTRATLDLLEFYAERARRQPGRADLPDRTRSLEVPPPVVRAIGTGLQNQARRSPQGALPVAEGLWSAAIREMRVLACWALSACPQPEVAAWLEAHAAEMEDPVVLQTAVERGLAGWRRADGRAYVARIDRWIVSPRTPLQALGLRALEAGLDLPELDDLQHAFQALAELPRPVRGEARHALESVLGRLADRSPAETTRFLLEEIDRAVPGMERLVKSVAVRLPPAQRLRLTAALAARSSSARRS